MRQELAEVRVLLAATHSHLNAAQANNRQRSAPADLGPLCPDRMR